MSSNNDMDINMIVSRLYETLKSPSFLQSLYWDILSGLKEKNSYQLMRSISDRIFDIRLEDLYPGEDENNRRRTIVSDLCIMSHTIDKVFSKIMFLKLKQACEAQIRNIIQDLRNERKITENTWARMRSNPEVARSVLLAEAPQQVSIRKSPYRKRENPKPPVRVERRKRKVNLLRDIKKVNSNKGILDDLKKVNGLMETDTDNSNRKKSPRKRLGGRITEIPKKNTPGPDASTPLRKLTKETVATLSSDLEIGEDNDSLTVKDSLQVNNQESPKKNAPGSNSSTPLKKLTKENVAMLSSDPKVNKDNVTRLLKDSLPSNNGEDTVGTFDDSDAESEISVGTASIATVSSVHTSDLSSFDDAISLSSDDEAGEKKKVPLKEVQRKFSEGGNSDSFTAGQATEPLNIKIEPCEEVDEKMSKNNQISMDDAVKSLIESTSLRSPFESGLSKRARKPNSRYSSDNIICTVVKVKERKKGERKISTMSHRDGKLSSDELSPLKKKLKVDSDIIGDVAAITQSVNNEGSHNNTNISIPMKVETPDLYRSQSVNRSLTSRRTAPVTLFST